MAFGRNIHYNKGIWTAGALNKDVWTAGALNKGVWTAGALNKGLWTAGAWPGRPSSKSRRGRNHSPLVIV